MVLENIDTLDTVLLLLSAVFLIVGILLGPKKKKPVVVYKTTLGMKIKRKISSVFSVLRNRGRGGT